MRTLRSLAEAVAVTLLLLLTVTSAAAADVCLGREGQVCAGCHTVVVCLGEDGGESAAVGNVTCPPSSPFCSGGTCVTHMDVNNPCEVTPRPSTAFRCPSGHTGYLPDPFDCARYHYCVEGTAWDYTCDVAPSTVYHHASASCVPPTQTACSNIVCPADADAQAQGPQGNLQLYGPDNTVGFRCEGAGNVTVILCPANHRLDVHGGSSGSPTCVRYCPRDGRQPVNDDKSLFYECLFLADGTLSKPLLRECPMGTEFDSDLERCRVLPGQEF